MLDYSKRKPNKIWVDKGGSEFYNKAMKSWLEKNDIEYIQHTMKENLLLLNDLLEL